MMISEFLPDPSGKDADGEWIRLFNDGGREIDLSGWRLQDASGKNFVFKNQKIKSGERLTLDYKTTKISLNNNDETLFLYDQNGTLIDEAGYSGKAIEGGILTRGTNGFVFGGIPPSAEKYFNKNLTRDEASTSGELAYLGATSAVLNEKNFNFDIFLIVFFSAAALAAVSLAVLKKIEELDSFLE